MLTTKYSRFISLAQRLLKEKGVEVTYCEYVGEVTGQGINVDDRVEKHHRVYIYLGDATNEEQGGRVLPSKVSSAIMEAKHFKPKPGDCIIHPDGTRLQIRSTTSPQPDGVAIYYDLNFKDG